MDKATYKGRTGEAWVKMKNVNARKVMREDRCMFVGSKDSSTGTPVHVMLYSDGAKSDRVSEFDVPREDHLNPI
jgi:hypothetical protein